jgi:hypothetical protein
LSSRKKRSKNERKKELRRQRDYNGKEKRKLKEKQLNLK